MSVSKQRALAHEVMRVIGFPFDRGRLDESSRAFTEGVWGDVRIATRYDVNEPFTGLMGVLHEVGQAMYDLGLPAAWRDQPVGRDRGMALEESQSLLLEMIIGRSRPFLTWLRPLLEKHFGCTGPEWDVENLYRTLTRVRRSAIRADADELTYPVHIMLRYDLEKQIFEGTMPVRDLPEAWRAGFDRRLGLRPSSDTEGCLQDPHWALGQFGYFPSYALGSFIAAQIARNPAHAERTLRRGDRERPFRRAVRVAAAERARPRCERRRAGTDQGCDRQDALGGAVAALRGVEVPRNGSGSVRKAAAATIVEPAAAAPAATAS